MQPAELILSEEAKQDIRDLLAEDETHAVGAAAMRQCKALQLNPYQGEKLRYKANRKPLSEADCRKVKFDEPEHLDDSPKRYRVVYRLEPHEGSADRVYVLIVALKREAYGEGTARAAARLRQLAGELAQRRRPKRGA